MLRCDSFYFYFYLVDERGKEWYNTPFDLFLRKTGRENKQAGYEYKKTDHKIHNTE